MSEHIFNRQAWEARTIFEQMGNIGSEVGRAYKAMQRQDTTAANAALYRGLDLIDATATAWARTEPRRAVEILRARELFARSVEDGVIDAGFENYFMNFAVAARMRQFA